MAQDRDAAVSTVDVGQVWADNDKRSAGRLIKVLEIRGGRALVVNELGRPSLIRLSRFRPTSNGYRLATENEARRFPR